MRSTLNSFLNSTLSASLNFFPSSFLIPWLLLSLSFNLWGNTPSVSGHKILQQSLITHPEILQKEQERISLKESLSQQLSLPLPKASWMLDSTRAGNMEGGVDGTGANSGSSGSSGSSGAMESWILRQEIPFPWKFRVQAQVNAWKNRSLELEQSLNQWTWRKRFLSASVSWIASQMVLDLMMLQKDTFRIHSRWAESSRATGTISQQDEMKVHVISTQLQTQILLQQQTILEKKIELEALLTSSTTKDKDNDITTGTLEQIQKSKEDFFPKSIIHLSPKKTDTLMKLSSLQETGPLEAIPLPIQIANIQREEKITEHRLAQWSWAPDFELMYQRPYKNAPPNSYSFEVGITLPLWFYSQQNRQISAARAEVLKSQYQIDVTRKDWEAKKEIVVNQIKTLQEMLVLYESSLIPQATTLQNTLYNRYKGGKTPSNEWLESQRNLYQAKIEMTQYHSQLILAWVELETLWGRRFTDLPHWDGTNEGRVVK